MERRYFDAKPLRGNIVVASILHVEYSTLRRRSSGHIDFDTYQLWVDRASGSETSGARPKTDRYHIDVAIDGYTSDGVQRCLNEITQGRRGNASDYP